MYYLIDEKLIPTSLKMCMKSDRPYVAVMTSAEWKVEKDAFRMGIDLDIEYDRIHELQEFQTTGKVIVPFYYLVLYESDKRQLENQLRETEQLLRNGELNAPSGRPGAGGIPQILQSAGL